MKFHSKIWQTVEIIVADRFIVIQRLSWIQINLTWYEGNCYNVKSHVHLAKESNLIPILAYLTYFLHKTIHSFRIPKDNAMHTMRSSRTYTWCLIFCEFRIISLYIYRQFYGVTLVQSVLQYYIRNNFLHQSAEKLLGGHFSKWFIWRQWQLKNIQFILKIIFRISVSKCYAINFFFCQMIINHYQSYIYFCCKYIFLLDKTK